MKPFHARQRAATGPRQSAEGSGEGCAHEECGRPAQCRSESSADPVKARGLKSQSRWRTNPKRPRLQFGNQCILMDWSGKCWKPFYQESVLTGLWAFCCLTL